MPIVKTPGPIVISRATKGRKGREGKEGSRKEGRKEGNLSYLPPVSF